MAGSVHWALIVVRGTLSSWARCPVNSVLDSSNTAGTAPGGPPGQAFLLDATGPLSRFQGPKFRQGMDRFNVRSDRVVRPAQGLARIGSGCHVSVGGTFRCSPPRRSSPYTACCLSLSTQASRSPSRPHPRSRCPARSPGESNRPPAPPLPTPRPAAGPHVPPAHLLQKPSPGPSGAASGRSGVVCTWSSTLIPSSRKSAPGPGPTDTCSGESPRSSFRLGPRTPCHSSSASFSSPISTLPQRKSNDSWLSSPHGLCGPRRATGLQ